MGKTALLAGASGLVGGYCLKQLLEDPDYSSVISIGRRMLGIEHDKLKEVTVDFDHLEAAAECFEVDHIYCCLGTTIKKAGSQEAFRRVDEVYPLSMATLGERSGAKVFSIVTALGADAGSPIFYNKVKGQVQDQLKAKGISSIQVLQPSLLLGDRQEQRMGEQIGKVVMKAATGIMLGPLRKYRPIHGNQVAKAMIAITKTEVEGFHLHPSDELQQY